MVLDISGSMGGSRIANMRSAAREFIDTVIQGDEEAQGVTSISLVPYSATVNLGSQIAPYYNLSDEHDYSHCMSLPSNSFHQTAIWRTTQLDRIAHFDPYGSGGQPDLAALVPDRQ